MFLVAMIHDRRVKFLDFILKISLIPCQVLRRSFFVF